jgi:hypothetical protein
MVCLVGEVLVKFLALMLTSFVLQVPKSRPSSLRSELVLLRRCVRERACKLASSSNRPTRSVWLLPLVSSLASNRLE